MNAYVAVNDLDPEEIDFETFCTELADELYSYACNDIQLVERD